MGLASRALGRFTTRDLVLIAVLAALGIAVKPVVVPLAHLITAPLFIPGGALAGGLYMMWLVVGMGIVGKRGTATLIALVQALLVTFTGVVGSHGALSLVSYTAPGIVMDLGLLLVGHTACCLGCCVLAGILANVTGTLMVSLIFFRLPLIPLALAVSTAAFSGGVGGVIAWQVIRLLRRYHIGVAPPPSHARKNSRDDAGAGPVLTASVVALTVAMALLLAGCDSGLAASGAAPSATALPRAGATGIPLVSGVNGRNAVLKAEASSAGATGTVPLNRALHASGRRTAGRVAVYWADGSIDTVAAKACSIASSGQLLVRDHGTAAVTGIVLDPPRASIRDVAVLVRRSLAAGTKTLIVYLDGFGWDQYVAHRDAGDIPHLARLSAARAVTVFPTITPVTFAAMVSGEDPATTGVRDRSTHTLACATVFDWAEARGKSTSLIEGDLQILDLTANTTLNADADGDGFTDDEVLAAAESRLAEGQPDLMLVHFHGIDDAAHASGPFSAATAEHVRQADAMVGALMELWTGRLIVVADHGLHAVGDGSTAGSRGEHGAFRAEDLFIPLLTGQIERHTVRVTRPRPSAATGGSWPSDGAW